jgi:vacuolar protein sorting-associated protein 13A/C
MNKLEEAQMLKEQKEKEKEDKGKEKKQDDSFAIRLATKIVDNLQIDVTNIHIRYEDDVTDPQVTFSLAHFVFLIICCKLITTTLMLML